MIDIPGALSGAGGWLTGQVSGAASHAVAEFLEWIARHPEALAVPVVAVGTAAATMAAGRILGAWAGHEGIELLEDYL